MWENGKMGEKWMMTEDNGNGWVEVVDGGRLGGSG